MVEVRRNWRGINEKLNSKYRMKSEQRILFRCEGVPVNQCERVKEWQKLLESDRPTERQWYCGRLVALRQVQG